ncbi:restriction endonuclease subunit S [Streptococcus thermophilus]|uniref:restriction endonuclease subunit S n=1 Tax=Streptococcus thermophilus TaxID=1308 RepID=UPI003A7F7713
MTNSKHVPKRRFSGFEEAWYLIALEEIAKITMGQSPNGETYSDTPNDYILVQGNADLVEGWVKPRLWTTQVTKRADKGDIIMSVRAPAGEVGRTNYDVVIGRGVAAIKGNDFIFQRLIKMNLDGYWKSLSAGSTFESLNSDDIKRAIFKIPSIHEQEYIGRFFETLDSFISLHQHKLDKLKNLKKAYLSEMFPAEGERVPKRRFPGFEGEWEQKKLGEILETVSYKEFMKEPQSSGDFEVIQQGHDSIIGFADGIPCNDFEDVVIFGDHTLSLYKPKNPFFVATDGVRILKGKNSMNGYYLYVLLDRFKPKSEGYKRYFGILTNVELSMTNNIAEQEKIALLFQQIDKSIELQQQKLDKLNDLKKAYLNELFV